MQENSTRSSLTKTVSVRVHRTGTLTAGLMLIIFGVLFIVHFIFPAVSYIFIFRMWPCILILLGIEILVANFKTGAQFLYDRGAVFIVIFLSVFAMFMAFCDTLIQYAGVIWKR